MEQLFQPTVQAGSALQEEVPGDGKRCPLVCMHAVGKKNHIQSVLQFSLLSLHFPKIFQRVSHQAHEQECTGWFIPHRIQETSQDHKKANVEMELCCMHHVVARFTLSYVNLPLDVLSTLHCM